MLNTRFPRTILALAAVALALWAAPAAARAQTVTGTLQGTVADQNGAALPGATVTILNVVLQPAAVSETIIVTSQEAPINTTNAEIKGSLTAQEILDKPSFNQGS